MLNLHLDPTAIRVLLTGFGPTQRFKENPSWLAVEPLHNTVLIADPPVDPGSLDHQPIITDDMDPLPVLSQQIHVTALQIPSTYQAILSMVPGLHARPPVLPIQDDSLPPPPQDGYDFMFHVGVIGRGPLRMEKLSHRTGYRMKDADDQYAPVIPPNHAPRDAPEPNPMEEMHRLMLESISNEQTTVVSGLPPELPVDSPDHIQRGFGKPLYENCPDELNTEVDVTKLINHLKESGIENVYSSMDAGHYVSDFCMYCSLAESKRAAAKQEKIKERSTPPKSTPVLVMHCPPVGLPLTSEEVTDAIKKIILWICARPQP